MREPAAISRTGAAVALLALCSVIPFLVACLAVAGAIQWTADLVSAVRLRRTWPWRRPRLRAAPAVSRVSILRTRYNRLGVTTPAPQRPRGDVCAKEP